jgi:hypothetical protein
MTSYNPPTESLPEFNTSVFTTASSTTALTLDVADERYRKLTNNSFTNGLSTTTLTASGVISTTSTISADSGISTASTISATGAITASSGIVLPTSFSTPSSGRLGYLQTITGSTSTALTTATALTTSFTLGVGVWIINFYTGITATTAGTTTVITGGISTTTGTGGLIAGAYNRVHISNAYALNDNPRWNGSYTIVVTASTTYYLLIQATFATGAFTAQTGATATRIA